MGTQGPQAGGQGLAQPPEADDQDPGVVEGDGQLLQGDLERAFGGGHRIQHRQLLPGEVVPERQPTGLRQLLQPAVHHPGAHQLAGTQAVQHLLQMVPALRQRRVQPAVRPRRREGQDHAVRPVRPRRGGLAFHSRPLFQGVGMYAVPVVRQQRGQRGLPGVAPHHPDIFCPQHKKPPRPSGPVFDHPSVFPLGRAGDSGRCRPSALTCPGQNEKKGQLSIPDNRPFHRLQVVGDMVRFHNNTGAFVNDPLMYPRIARFEAKFRIHR